MVKLTCLVRRKQDMTPEEFHAYWRDVHGPLVAATKSARHVLRYEQHHRPLADYRGDDDPGFDGHTEQWFESEETYRASLAEEDFSVIAEDIPNFLDVEKLHFVLTEVPVVIIDGKAGW